MRGVRGTVPNDIKIPFDKMIYFRYAPGSAQRGPGGGVLRPAVFVVPQHEGKETMSIPSEVIEVGNVLVFEFGVQERDQQRALIVASDLALAEYGPVRIHEDGSISSYRYEGAMPVAVYRPDWSDISRTDQILNAPALTTVWQRARPLVSRFTDDVMTLERGDQRIDITLGELRLLASEVVNRYRLDVTG